MPSVPYNRIAPVDEIRVGQTIVHEDWNLSSPSFYRIVEIVTVNRITLTDNHGVVSTHNRSSFGSPYNWILIEDDFWGEGPMKRKVTRRPKSGFGLFVKKLDDHDKTLDIHPA